MLHDESRLFVDITAKDAEIIAGLTCKYQAHDHSIIDLRLAISTLQALKALHPRSTLRLLGYFGVLESLLTHSPEVIGPVSIDHTTDQEEDRATESPLG